MIMDPKIDHLKQDENWINANQKCRSHNSTVPTTIYGFFKTSQYFSHILRMDIVNIKLRGEIEKHSLGKVFQRSCNYELRLGCIFSYVS